MTTGGEITVRGCTPQNPLVAGNTAEVCGGNMLDLLTAKLMHYALKDATPEYDIAESIDTTDNLNFTVKLKQGYKFHDGTEVKAHNFVDAWNYTAAGVNGQQGSYFFEPIEGYADVACPNEECSPKPKTDKLSGLKVVDDYTFTIKTANPVSNLVVRLGYSAFAPQPDAFFENPDAFKTKPIGAGPYQAEMIDDTQYVFSKFGDYSGEFKGKPDKITFRIYNDPGAAYRDVQGGNLDATDIIPPDMMVDDLYKSDLPDRWLVREQGVIQAIGFSPTDEQLKNRDLRRAISMGIDRDLITKQIYNGSRTPADSFVSPVVNGYKAGACGEWCTFDAAKAKALYDKAGGYQGTLTFGVNQDGGHKPMAEAVCNSLKNALGLDCAVEITPDFKTLRDQLNKKERKGIFRQGWQMDYPSIENFLAPIYAKGASSNDVRYDNPEFQADLQKGNAAKTTDEANKFYQDAEAKLVEDLPAFPTWYDAAVIGWSDRVTNVETNAFGVIDYAQIEVKQ
ncbi:oligopeptide transport system substrate-binding protein [Microlunatus parietis]|uniref:Oligopeptide transport system substrate-binding protein n=1 Tax=Microlunatus parietis TaxID=682979 RepID=A0A7Y9I4U1_9ACTN|nr:oligopeptide transport system substrate-binding protein [Microlunatus parietis]